MGRTGLTQIVADDLQDDEVFSLIEYVTAMSSGQVTQHKKIIEVTGLTNKKVKFLLHKFLYTRHLPEYGVLDTAGNFEIVHLKPEKKQSEQHETLTPTMDVRLPVVIPHWVQPSDMIEWEGRPPPTKIRDKKK
jgi:alkylated DNA nucleotide flippase Atl1